MASHLQEPTSSGSVLSIKWAGVNIALKHRGKSKHVYEIPVVSEKPTLNLKCIITICVKCKIYLLFLFMYQFIHFLKYIFMKTFLVSFFIIVEVC